jgi:hypothetical protein
MNRLINLNFFKRSITLRALSGMLRILLRFLRDKLDPITAFLFWQVQNLLLAIINQSIILKFRKIIINRNNNRIVKTAKNCQKLPLFSKFSFGQKIKINFKKRKKLEETGQMLKFQ